MICRSLGFIVSSICLAVLAPTPTRAEALTAGRNLEAQAEIDAVFSEFDSTHSPGCAVGVVQDGRLVLERGYGMASLEHGIPNATDIVYYIGSVSKQFVAASILLAAEQGHLSLDDDVRDHMNELPAWERPITIRHLIHHTSGLRDYLELMDLADMPAANLWRRDQIVDLLARQRALNFTPGDEHLYSNSGYFLMAEIIEKATGKSLRQFAKENIFEPLSMSATHFHDERTEIVQKRAAGYEPKALTLGYKLRWYLNFEQVGSGGLMTTVQDLARWDANFYDNRLGNGTLVEEMQRTGYLNNGEALEYAAGITVGEHRGLKMVRHGGAFMGFRAELLRFPDHRLSVISLCNTTNADPGRRSLEVAEAVLGDSLEPDNSPAGVMVSEDDLETVTLPDERLRRLAGAYRKTDGSAFRRLAVENGSLVYMRPGGDATRLAALDESRFVMLDVPARVGLEFEPTGADGRPRIRVSVGGEVTSVFEPVEAAQPDSEALRAYAGTYYSAELDVTYRVESRDDGLAVRIGSRPDFLDLAPTVRDEFVGSWLTLAFERREDQVAGFVLDSGRVRGLAFERQQTDRDGPGSY